MIYVSENSLIVIIISCLTSQHHLSKDKSKTRQNGRSIESNDEKDNTLHFKSHISYNHVNVKAYHKIIIR